MRNSCRFAVAIEILTFIGYQEGDRVTSTRIAQSVRSHPVHVRRLLMDLKRARLVDVCKGSGAGARLDRAPGRISLADIFRAVEDHQPFAKPTCAADPRCPVGAHMDSILERIFAAAGNALERHLAQTTLGDVLSEVRSER